jgi:acyl carrier protein
MVPASFVMLPAFPLMPNGKLNRQALRKMGVAEKQVEYVGARTPTEQLLADVFADVLRLDRVSINASFFELGGHSLSATQAVLRIREVFNIELPLLAIFRAATVAELAIALEAFGLHHGVDVNQVAEVRIRLTAMSDDEAQSLLTEKMGFLETPRGV